MSPRRGGDAKGGRAAKAKRPAPPVTGSGPGGKVEVGDIRAKLAELRGDVDQVTEDAKPYLTYAAVAGAVVVVTVAFLLGRRMGKRKATWVEVRRL